MGLQGDRKNHGTSFPLPSTVISYLCPYTSASPEGRWKLTGAQDPWLWDEHHGLWGKSRGKRTPQDIPGAGMLSAVSGYYVIAKERS